MNDTRLKFVRRAQEPGANVAHLCREFGISRKTGYKWIARAREDGLRGLRERSRRPQRSPQRLDECTICALGKLKLAHLRWGPKKIRVLYAKAYGDAPSLSSCHRVLRKLGLVQPRRRRVRRVWSSVIAEPAVRGPNDLWTVDFKGWWRALDGRRCEPLTVRDAWSKCVLATVVMPQTGTEAVKAVFVDLFRRYGLPRAIRSDNGSPFATANAPLRLSQLAAWWISLGIDPVRGRPGCPQDNSAHERMHGDIADEISDHVQPDPSAQQAALDLWRREYNEVRPHESLQGRCPADVYRKSDRRYDVQPAEYSTGYYVRRVCMNGTIKWHGQRIFITTALAGHEVGLRSVAKNRYELWLYHVLVGTIDSQTCAFQVAPSRDLERARLSA
jgi:transposase InsO family protein